MTIEFPEDVKAAAIAAGNASRQMGVLRTGNPWEPIAQAILTEAERCARAAERRGHELGEAAVGSDIATTIRDRL